MRAGCPRLLAVRHRPFRHTSAMDTPTRALFPVISRPAIQQLQSSLIREVANAAMGRTDVLPFWFGESDRPTPEFIREAAIASLSSGETFYSQRSGPPLPPRSDRDLSQRPPQHVDRARADRRRRLGCLRPDAGHADGGLGRRPRRRRDAALAQHRRDPKDPRGQRRARAAEGRPTASGRSISTGLLAALTPDTRLVIINSPNNPTGWTIEDSEVDAILAHCRKHGIWVLSDDVYERLVHDPVAEIGAILPRPLRARRPHPLGQQLLQGLVDDRLARRLDHGARGAGQ